jgi:hypothetical protein
MDWPPKHGTRQASMKRPLRSGSQRARWHGLRSPGARRGCPSAPPPCGSELGTSDEPLKPGRRLAGYSMPRGSGEICTHGRRPLTPSLRQASMLRPPLIGRGHANPSERPKHGTALVTTREQQPNGRMRSSSSELPRHGEAAGEYAHAAQQWEAADKPGLAYQAWVKARHRRGARHARSLAHQAAQQLGTRGDWEQAAIIWEQIGSTRRAGSARRRAKRSSSARYATWAASMVLLLIAAVIMIAPSVLRPNDAAPHRELPP